MTTWSSLDCEVTLENGILTVTGNGAMNNYSSTSQPWKDVSDTITKIVIEHGVTNIGNSFAYNCINVTDVTISDTVTYIGFSAFMKCKNLKSINIPANVTVMEQECFSQCSSLETAEINANILELPPFAFDSCINLKTVTFPNTLDRIWNNAFSSCSSITSINLPDNLTKLTANVFNDCTSLETIVIPESIAMIGTNCFKNTKIKELKFGKGLTNIYLNGLSYMVELETLDMGDAVLQSFDYDAISHCPKLKTVILPNDVKILNQGLFTGCTSLSEITIPESVTKIDSYVFKDTSLRKITFNGEYTRDLIGTYAFEDLTLELIYYKKKSGWDSVINNPSLGGALLVIYNGIEIKTINNMGLMYFWEKIKSYFFNKRIKNEEIDSIISTTEMPDSTTETIMSSNENSYLDINGLQYFYSRIKHILGGFLPLSGGNVTGSINAVDYSISSKVELKYNSSSNALDFIFK